MKTMPEMLGEHGGCSAGLLMDLCEGCCGGAVGEGGGEVSAVGSLGRSLALLGLTWLDLI